MHKYALVTGGTKGIGKQIVLDLLQRGIFVITTTRENNKTDIEFSEISNNYTILKQDFSNLHTVDLFIAKILRHTQKIDYIFLNAGSTNREPFSEITLDSWNNVFNVNLHYPMFIVQRLKSNIQENGRIVFIGSILGQISHAMSISYGVSKASLNMLVKYLAKEFATLNVTVNNIAPGFIETDWHKNKTQELRRKIESKILLKRFGTPSEISKLALSLIDNAYINGQTLTIDGGYSLE